MAVAKRRGRRGTGTKVVPKTRRKMGKGEAAQESNRVDGGRRVDRGRLKGRAFGAQKDERGGGRGAHHFLDGSTFNPRLGSSGDNYDFHGNLNQPLIAERGARGEFGPDGLSVGRVHLGNLPFSSIDVPGPPADLDSDFSGYVTYKEGRVDQAVPLER